MISFWEAGYAVSYLIGAWLLRRAAWIWWRLSGIRYPFLWFFHRRVPRTRTKKRQENGSGKPHEKKAKPRRLCPGKRMVFRRTVTVCLPLLAAGGLCLTVIFWRQVPLGLSVAYNGKRVGYITNERVYESARLMAQGRVEKANLPFSGTPRPEMALAPVTPAKCLSESELCDALLEHSAVPLAEASGVYVDGTLRGVVKSHAALQRMLDRILARQPKEEEKTPVFLAEVTIVDGLYLQSFMETPDKLQEALTDPAGVVRLMVGVAYTVTREEPLPFVTETVESALYPRGQEIVQRAGCAGRCERTVRITANDEQEVSRRILCETVLREPVSRRVIVGTGEPEAAHGRFIWPLPYTHNITSGYGKRGRSVHHGIDICREGVFGQPILAADAGTVVTANTNVHKNSYGQYVMIDHGNGYQTVYAHCSRLKVVPGQKVAQGEIIALVGSTGNSTGPHLHFEVHRQGKLTDPRAYF